MHTCISTVNAYDEESQISSQLALINACLAAHVTRFVPPEFEGPPAQRGNHIGFLRAKNRILAHLDAHVPRDTLQWSVFVSGGFLDYFTRGAESSGCLMDLGMPILLDMEARVAEVPQGDAAGCLISLISVDDLARFVTRALELETWPREMRAFATRARVEELAEMAERATGWYPSFRFSPFAFSSFPSHG